MFGAIMGICVMLWIAAIILLDFRRKNMQPRLVFFKATIEGDCYEIKR